MKLKVDMTKINADYIPKDLTQRRNDAKERKGTKTRCHILEHPFISVPLCSFASLRLCAFALNFFRLRMLNGLSFLFRITGTLILTLFMFLSCASLSAAHELLFDHLSFENAKGGGALEQWIGQPVHVRGFWYPLSGEEGVLASHPLLKSCCLQTPSKIDQQILVKGKALAFLPSQRALTVKGVFNIQPAFNSKGELVQLFVLENATEVSYDKGHSILWILGGLVALVTFVIFKWGRRG